MERIRKITGSRFGFALISNIITLVASLAIFTPFWEESDDVFISLIPEGAYGIRDSHLVYPNVIYGKILCLLQSLAGSVRWNAVLQYLFLFAALTAFVYVIAKNKRGRFLSCVILLAVFFEVYVSLQYSKTSAVIAVACFLVLFELTKDKTISKKTVRSLAILSFICLFFSMILREESFLLGTLAAGVFGICLVISDITGKEFAAKIRSYISFFAPVFILLAAAHFVNQSAYSTGEWGAFRQYDNARVQMTDFHHNALLFTDHGYELEALGLSENDALMLITWQFGDDGFVTPKLMDKISAIDRPAVNADLLKAFAKSIYDDILQFNTVVLALILLTGLCIPLPTIRQKDHFPKLVIISQALLSAVILFWYQYSCRWSHRVVYALLMCVIFVLVYLLANVSDKEFDPALTICVSLILICAALTQKMGNEFDKREYERSAPEYEELISYMKDNKDKLFVADTFTLIDYGRYDVFSAAEPGQFDNLACVGAWTTNSPIERPITLRFGYSNPFDALMARDEKVILIDNCYPESKALYCTQHGDGKEYVAEELEPAANISLYRIR